MKTFTLVLAATLLGGCSMIGGEGGNPDHTPYAGEPGSVYDRAANPPQQIGTVAYNPPQPAPVTMALPAPGATTAAPLPPPTSRP